MERKNYAERYLTWRVGLRETRPAPHAGELRGQSRRRVEERIDACLDSYRRSVLLDVGVRLLDEAHEDIEECRIITTDGTIYPIPVPNGDEVYQ
jgi:hypothetical protein